MCWMQINSSKLPIKLELSSIPWSPNDLASPAEVNPRPHQHQPRRFLTLNKTIFLSSTSFDLFNLYLLYVTFSQLFFLYAGFSNSNRWDIYIEHVLPCPGFIVCRGSQSGAGWICGDPILHRVGFYWQATPHCTDQSLSVFDWIVWWFLIPDVPLLIFICFGQWADRKWVYKGGGRRRRWEKWIWNSIVRCCSRRQTSLLFQK